MAENFYYLFGFAFTEQTVVDVYAHKVFAYRFDKQRRDYRRINAAGKREQNFFIADLRFESRYLFGYERICEFFRIDSLHRFGSSVFRHFCYLF
jgi:hypothetical protein